jgi:hypothetical protein
MRSHLHREDGQAVPLAAGLVGLAVVLTLALAELAGDVVDAGRARTAADAAALAAVHGGRAAAGRLAASHDAAIVGWLQRGAVVSVTVRVGDAVVTASATGG